MGASTREKGVLKLVYPGRRVEIYNEPITAAEVMRKNPRHCVARPDVFKYPWIVVRPESVLSPGRVFYIVPLYTIYCLLKARGYYKQPPPPQSRSPKSHDRRCNPRKLSAGMTPTHQSHGQPLRRPSLCTPWSGVVSSEEENSDESQSQQSYVVNRITHHGQPLRRPSLCTPWSGVVSSEEENSDESQSQQSYVVNRITHHGQPLRRPSLCTPWSGVVSSEEENSNESQSQQSYVVNRITYQEHESPIDLKEYHCKRSSAIAALPKNDNRNTKIKCYEQVNGLKSCLRKQDSVRKSYNLRVTFASTLKCRVISPPTEPPGFFIC